MKDAVLKNMAASHGWQSEGSTWVYGVCVPFPNVDPNDVADHLIGLGIHVLPGIHDTEGIPHPAIHAALAKHGIGPKDGTREIVKRLHEIHGMPALKLHLY